jgi:hypothetical protein
MSVRSQRNLRDRTGVDSRGIPAFYNRLASRMPITRQYFEARRRNLPMVPEHAFSRASIGTQPSPNGVPVVVPSGRERWLNLGDPRRTLLLVEEASTNFLLNSGAPATQTVTLAIGVYVLWQDGPGSTTIAAGTGVATGLGAATAASPLTINVTTAGTFTVTPAGLPTRFQLENSPVRTSYIPTGGATVSRQGDSLIWTPTALGSGLIGSAMTLVVEAMIPQQSTVIQAVASVDDNTSAERISIRNAVGSNTVQLFIISGGVSLGTLSLGSMTPGVPFRVAYAGQGGDHAAVMTGGTLQTATFSFPVGLSKIRYGADSGVPAPLNGAVGIVARRLSRLPNAQLLDYVRI